MTDTGYVISVGDHQTFSDFLSAVTKGTLTKPRMAELAQVQLDQLNAHKADGGQARGLETAMPTDSEIQSAHDALKRQHKDLVLTLQKVSGITAPIESVVTRLWEVRECVDALMRLPSKAGVRDALARVINLRAGLLVCQTFVGQVVETCRGIEDFDQMPDSLTSDLERLGDTGHLVWQEIERLAKPPAAPVE